MTVGFFELGTDVVVRLNALRDLGEIISYSFELKIRFSLTRTMTFTFKDINASITF